MNTPTLDKPSHRPRPEPDPQAPAPGAGDGEFHEDELPDIESLPRPGRGMLFVLGVGLLLAIGAAFVFGYLPKLHQRAELRQEADARADARVPVSLAYPTRSPAAVKLVLPGSMEPLQESALYARTTGYLKRWLVDIGAHVRAGQLLAEIDSPEVDAQLQQARADLANAQANVDRAQVSLDFNQSTLKRYEALVATQGVTQQELDQYRQTVATSKAALESARAAVASDEANVKRLEDLVAFEKVTAPFAGTVTARNYDVGALIGANGASGAMPLFRLSQTDVLRVWVHVPQNYAPEVKPGMEAVLTVREFPGQKFRGKIANTAGALDTSTRTLLTEVRLNNADGQLLSGMFSEVTIDVTEAKPPLIIPVGALISNAEGNQVAVVAGDGVAHFKQVELGRDFGKSLEVTTGLSPDDRIVTNPGEQLVEGCKVRIVSGPDEETPDSDSPRPEVGHEQPAPAKKV